MGDRCTGHCCREFYLPFSNQEVADYAAGVNLPPNEITDIGFMARNAVFIGKGPDGSNYFTCRMYDSATGNCGAYERRPRVCSGYPSYTKGDKCSNKGCTWTEERATGEHLLTGRATTTTRDDALRHCKKRGWTSLSIPWRTREPTNITRPATDPTPAPLCAGEGRD